MPEGIGWNKVDQLSTRVRVDQSDLGPSVNANAGNQTDLGDFLTPIPFLWLLLNEEVNPYCREERDTSPVSGQVI